MLAELNDFLAAVMNDMAFELKLKLSMMSMRYSKVCL